MGSIPPNGSIASIETILETPGARYSRLLYYSGGLRIAGYLAVPLAPGPHPVVFYNRGGNAEFGALEGTEIVSLAEAGYLAAATQYRGGPGSEGRDESGGADLDDVFALTDLVRRMPEADTTRMGMMGFSRGGMMTHLVLKHQALMGTPGVTAAVTIGGVADLFLWAEDRPRVQESVYRRHMGRVPDEDPQHFRDRSATFWPHLINVPILLLHGEADDRVNVRQSRKLYELLKNAGKTVELIIYPEGTHGLGRYNHGFPEALAWFQRYLSQPGEDRTWQAHAKAITSARTAMKRALAQLSS